MNEPTTPEEVLVLHKLLRADPRRYFAIVYETALEDYSRGEALEPEEWASFASLYQAGCHARLGDETSALACCARLPDDHWTPGLHGAPAGDKAAVADALRRIAAEARAGASLKRGPAALQSARRPVIS